jgi:hypothetical protein
MKRLQLRMKILQLLYLNYVVRRLRPSGVHFPRSWFGLGPLDLEIVADKVAQVCLAFPLSVTSRMAHTNSSCAYCRCCIMLQGMISTAFVKGTSLPHNATCYMQGQFFRHVYIVAKKAPIRFVTTVCLPASSVRPHMSSRLPLDEFP